MKVGALTIGQSPRVDIIPEIQSVLGASIEIVERGVLDGLELEAVKKMSPRTDDDTLVTRMRDGTEVKVAKAHLMERMRHCISEFQTEPVEMIMLLCTGEFPAVSSKKILVRPDRIIRHVVQALLNEGRLGLVVPSPEQIPQLKKKWEKIAHQVVAKSVSPYTGTDEEMTDVAKKLASEDVDLVVLDCMGFDTKTRSLFKAITQKPVLLPRTVMARIVLEMI